MIDPDPRQRPASSNTVVVVALCCAVLLMAVYWIVRNGAQWAENDTAILAQIIRNTLETGRLIPETGGYGQGYGYPVLAALLITLGGADVARFQQILAPLLVVWLVVPAWLLYRELTGSGRGAALATVLLFVQSEFLFVVLRSSHEKYTRGLMFLCLYLFVSSFRSQGGTARSAMAIGALYLAMFGLIATNTFIAFSIIAALAITLALAAFGARLSLSEAPRLKLLNRRLVYVVATSTILAFLFMFYIYEPARRNILLFDSIGERLIALLLDVQTTTEEAAPYAAVSLGWINLPTYLFVSLANLTTLAASFLIWSWRSVQLMRRRPFRGRRELLLWSLYGAFGLLFVLSIVVDFSGAVAENFQVRSFPSLSIVAVAVIADFLMAQLTHGPANRRLVRYGIIVWISLLAITSTLKATNEPLLSNNWIFYRSYEQRALNWADGNNRSAGIWTDFNERLTTARRLVGDDSDRGNWYDAFRPGSATSNFLVTDITQARSLRLGIPFPIDTQSLRVYDNGYASLYHRRPVTPFQR